MVLSLQTQKKTLSHPKFLRSSERFRRHGSLRKLLSYLSYTGLNIRLQLIQLLQVVIRPRETWILIHSPALILPKFPRIPLLQNPLQLCCPLQRRIYMFPPSRRPRLLELPLVLQRDARWLRMYHFERLFVFGAQGAEFSIPHPVEHFHKPPSYSRITHWFFHFGQRLGFFGFQLFYRLYDLLVYLVVAVQGLHGREKVIDFLLQWVLVKGPWNSCPLKEFV